MHNFATCPLRSKALIFPDRYRERKPRPAKDPAQQNLSDKAPYIKNNVNQFPTFQNILLWLKATSLLANIALRICSLN